MKSVLLFFALAIQLPSLRAQVTYIGLQPEQQTGLIAYCVDLYTGYILPNCCLFFEHEYIPDSGGHKHNSSRPKGTISPSGTSCYSGGTGVPFTYKASKIGQDEKFRVCTGVICTNWTSVHVAYSPLFNFEVNPSYSVLIGATTSHPQNHSASSTLTTAVEAVNVQYHDEFYCVPEYQKVGVNDMSLEYGGVFDINQNWQPPHDWHSQGNSVDFRYKPNMPNSIIISPYVEARFLQICDDKLLRYHGVHDRGTSNQHIHCGVRAGN